MASKNQKLKSYTTEFKYKVVEEKVTTNSSYATLARKYKIPWTTIAQWVYKIKRDGALDIKQRGGWNAKEVDYKERYEILKKFQDFLATKTQNKK